MKVIKYKFLSAEIDNDQIFLEKSMGWNEVNEETAKQEAYNGEYEIYDDGQPEPEAPSGDDSYVWDELDAAYQAGYDEGYTEGVNSAYDQ